MEVPSQVLSDLVVKKFNRRAASGFFISEADISDMKTKGNEKKQNRHILSILLLTLLLLLLQHKTSLLCMYIG